VTLLFNQRPTTGTTVLSGLERTRGAAGSSVVVVEAVVTVAMPDRWQNATLSLPSSRVCSSRHYKEVSDLESLVEVNVTDICAVDVDRHHWD
jgi:hypothetical protein